VTGTSALRVVTVVATTGTPSKTKALAEFIVDRLAARVPVQAQTIDVRTLAADLGAAVDRDDLDDRTRAALETVESADVLVAATPVIRGSYSGMFKQFFDFVDQYGLAAKPVILAATGGSERHALAVDQVLRPLFAFFQAWTAPMGVYLSAGDFDGTTILNPEVYERIEVAVDDVIPVAHALAERVGHGVASSLSTESSR
jgi:FMN reductase